MTAIIIPIIALLMSIFASSSYAGNSYPFKGDFDFAKNEITIMLELDENSFIEAKAQRVSDDNYKFIVDIEHLQTPLFDLLSNVESSVQIHPDPSQYSKSNALLRGKIWSQYSLLDYKPVKELAGQFEIANNRLHLTEFTFSNLSCNGYIDLEKPHQLDMTINIIAMDMKDFLNIWSAKAQYESAGAVSGQIKASGTLDNLMLKGNLESRNGYVQKLDYKSILLNIEGVYPYMNIAESTVSKSDGVSFSLEGPFNLSDRKGFKRQIKDLNIAPLVKDAGSEREWTFKRFEPEDSETIEIKYQHREGDALGIGTTASDETDMFGFERTRKF